MRKGNKDHCTGTYSLHDSQTKIRYIDTTLFWKVHVFRLGRIVILSIGVRKFIGEELPLKTAVIDKTTISA